MKASRANGRRTNALQESVREHPTIGRVAGLSEVGDVFIRYPADSQDPPLAARTIVDLCPEDVGCEALLVFESGNPFRPVVVGLVRSAGSETTRRTIHIETRDDRLVLEAGREVVLRCGEASISLSEDGRVTIRGVSVLSRASGPNRIKGASVQIN